VGIQGFIKRGYKDFSGDDTELCQEGYRALSRGHTGFVRGDTVLCQEGIQAFVNRRHKALSRGDEGILSRGDAVALSRGDIGLCQDRRVCRALSRRDAELCQEGMQGLCPEEIQQGFVWREIQN
jgi:hypothetical protein